MMKTSVAMQIPSRQSELGMDCRGCCSRQELNSTVASFSIQMLNKLKHRMIVFYMYIVIIVTFPVGKMFDKVSWNINHHT